MTDTSSFFTNNQTRDVPRDQWGRYRLPEADGTETGWTRATTFAATLAEAYGLRIWEQRQVAWGFGRRPDLVQLLSTIAGPEDKKALGEIVDEAHIAAGTKAKANRGTAIHNACAAAQRGAWDAVPEWVKPFAAKYLRELERNGIATTPNGEWTERTCIVPEYHVAGTFDDIVRCPDGKFRILDRKTGNLDYSDIEFAIQMALYAHASAMRNYDTNSYEPMPAVERDYAIIARIDPETGDTKLWRVNIVLGWAWCRTAAEVLDIRKTKNVLTPYVADEAQVIVPVPSSQPFPGAPAALPGPDGLTEEQRYFSFWNDVRHGLEPDPPAERMPTQAEGREIEDALAEGMASALDGSGNDFAEQMADAAQQLTADEVAQVLTHDDELTADEENIALWERIEAELNKLPKAHIQTVAKKLMTECGVDPVGPEGIKLNQYIRKIAAAVVALSRKYGIVPPPVNDGDPAWGTAETNGAGKSATAQRKEGERRAAEVDQAKEDALRRALAEEIGKAPTVAALELLRKHQEARWTDEMNQLARQRAAAIDATDPAPPAVLGPLELIRGATDKRTLAMAWSQATNNGANPEGFTPEMQAASREAMSRLG